MPFIRPQFITEMIESAGIPFQYKNLLCVPGTNPDGTPFVQPATQIRLEPNVQSYYYPYYTNDSDQQSAPGTGHIPFGSQVQHARIATDFSIRSGPTDRVGFYYDYDEDLSKNREANYPNDWFLNNDRLVQVHCMALIESAAIALFQNDTLYPASPPGITVNRRQNGVGHEWWKMTGAVSDYNPFTDANSGMFTAIKAAYALGFVPNTLILTNQAWWDLRENTKALDHVERAIVGSRDDIGDLGVLELDWVAKVLGRYARVPGFRVFVGGGYFTPSPVIKGSGPTPPSTMWGANGEFYLYPAPDPAGTMPMGGNQYGWWQGVSPIQAEPEEKIGLTKAIACPSNLIYAQEVNHRYIINGYNLH